MKDITLKRILDIINESTNFNVSAEHLQTKLTDLGIDSITFIQLIVAIEEEFECEIPDTKLLITEMDTVQKIINVLQSIYDEQND